MIPQPLRVIPAVVADLPKLTPYPLDDYQRRQDETVKALLMALGLEEVPDGTTVRP